MEEILLLLQLLTLLAVGVLAALAKSYLPSYMKKKGENLATKEDISVITEEVEKVRSLHAVEVESFKTSLRLAAEQRSMLQSKRSEAELAFFESCVGLLGEKLPRSFGDIELQEIPDFRREVDGLFLTLYINYHKILLYSESGGDEIISAAERIAASAIEAKKLFDKAIGSYHAATHLAMIKAKQEHVEAMDLLQKSGGAGIDYRGQMDVATKEMFATFQAYLVALNQRYRANRLPGLPEGFLKA